MKWYYWKLFGYARSVGSADGIVTDVDGEWHPTSYGGRMYKLVRTAAEIDAQKAKWFDDLTKVLIRMEPGVLKNGGPAALAENFPGYFTTWIEMQALFQKAWDEHRMVADNPRELFFQLVNERDELLDLLSRVDGGTMRIMAASNLSEAERKNVEQIWVGHPSDKKHKGWISIPAVLDDDRTARLFRLAEAARDFLKREENVETHTFHNRWTALQNAADKALEVFPNPDAPVPAGAAVRQEQKS